MSDTTTKMTRGQYRKLLQTEYVRLAQLTGVSEKEAKAAVRPAAVTIDQLKVLNSELRRKLAADGIDHRSDDQRASDDTEKPALIAEINRLANAIASDGLNSLGRAQAGELSIPQMRQMIAKAKANMAAAARRNAASAARRDYEERRSFDAELAMEDAYIARDEASPALTSQVDRIMSLLAKRSRSGEGGGFMVGPTDRAGVERMTRAEASAYIDSLTGNY